MLNNIYIKSYSKVGDIMYNGKFWISAFDKNNVMCMGHHILASEYRKVIQPIIETLLYTIIH